MPRNGRPTGYSPTILPLVQCAATFGATAPEIADYLGIPLRSLERWSALHSDLWRALKLGKEASDARVERSLYQQAISGNVTAQIFWLKNRKPSEWRDVQAIDAAIGHYILSDTPLTEQQWIEQRTLLNPPQPESPESNQQRDSALEQPEQDQGLEP